jgi:hypothetical protein
MHQLTTCNALRVGLTVPALLLRSTVGGHAQPGQTRPAFEVASVKPNNNVSQPANFQLQPGGRVAITNLPLFQVIWAAYPYPNAGTDHGTDGHEVRQRLGGLAASSQ